MKKSEAIDKLRKMANIKIVPHPEEVEADPKVVADMKTRLNEDKKAKAKRAKTPLERWHESVQLRKEVHRKAQEKRDKEEVKKEQKRPESPTNNGIEEHADAQQTKADHIRHPHLKAKAKQQANSETISKAEAYDKLRSLIKK